MTWYGPEVPKTSDKLSNFDRVKVDPGQTSFFEGREFRTFKELNVPALTTYVIKIVVPVDIIFSQFSNEIELGHARIASVFGGTEGGSFSETLPVFKRNNMAVGPNKRYDPSALVVLTGGGTHTGGTELDVVRIKASGQQVQSTTVGVSPGDERGIGIGTYYFRIQNLHATDALIGMMHAAWEERVMPPASKYANTNQG